MLETFQGCYVHQPPNGQETTHVIAYRPTVLERILHAAGFFHASVSEAADHWSSAESYLMSIRADEMTERDFRGLHGNHPFLFGGVHGRYRTIVENGPTGLWHPPEYRLHEARGNAIGSMVTRLMNRTGQHSTCREENETAPLRRRESAVFQRRGGHYALLFGSEGACEPVQIEISCNLNQICEPLLDSSLRDGMRQGMRLRFHDDAISTVIGCRRDQGGYVLVDMQPSCPEYIIYNSAAWRQEPLRGTITQIRTEDLHSAVETIIGRTIPRTYR